MKTSPFNPFGRILRNEVEFEQEIVGAGAGDDVNNDGDAPVELEPAIIHTRDEADYTALAGSFDLTRIAGKTKLVHGLTTPTRVALLSAAAKGTRVITTGLPTDMAAELGEITVVRAWSKTREDGSKSSGSTPPAVYSVRKVVDPEAYARLKESDDFKAAFGQGEPTDSAF